MQRLPSLYAVRYDDLASMELKDFLERLLQKYHRTEFLWSDPLEFPHRYSDSLDQEVVALVSALLAYGKVKQIRHSVESFLARVKQTGLSPCDFVKKIEIDVGFGQDCLQGFVHRFNRGEDLALLLALVGRSWLRYGSLGSHFLQYLNPEDVDFAAALNQLIQDWKAWIAEEPSWSALFRRSPSFSYLLTAPVDGSCCKRWCMFLRWMGRKDELDLGLWCEGSPLASTFPVGRGLRASQLILPLDTHTGRISQYLQLTERKSVNWRAALEVTQALRECDSNDPAKYDFALARLGILNLCRRQYRAEICQSCDLLKVCRFARAGRVRKTKSKRENSVGLRKNDEG